MFLLDRVRPGASGEAEAKADARRHARPDVARAAFATIWAAAFTATASIATGDSRTSRRCSTTTASSPASTPQALRADRPRRLSPRQPRALRLRPPRDDRRRPAASMPRSTPTRRARKASSIAGTRPRCKSCSRRGVRTVRQGLWPRSASRTSKRSSTRRSLPSRCREIAAEMKLTEADLEKQLAPIREKLLAVRAKRVPPADRYEDPHGRQRPDDRRPGRCGANSQGAAVCRRSRKGGGVRADEAAHGRTAALLRHLCRRPGEAECLPQRLRVSGRRPVRVCTRRPATSGGSTAADELTAKQIELFADAAGGRILFHVERSRGAAGPRQGAGRYGRALGQFDLGRQLDSPGRRSRTSPSICRGPPRRFSQRPRGCNRVRHRPREWRRRFRALGGQEETRRGEVVSHG